MSSSELAGRLTRLKAGLDELLVCLEGEGASDAAAVDAVWSRVQQAFDGVRAGLADVAEADAAVQASLEHCRRLYAVALGLTARRRDEVSAERTALRAARTRLRRVRPGGTSGGACDVRG